MSGYIRRLPYLWLVVDDEPGPQSLRAYLERNSIALLSNWEKPALDPQSSGWLGSLSHQEKVGRSGLWNSNHVAEEYEPAFLDVLETHVSAMG